MRLCSIDLTNFRNYDRLRLDIPDGTHVFHGANAQGKTNLLEAIYLCTCARSHRTGRDEELVKHGCDFYRVSIQFVTDRGLNESVTLEYKHAQTRGGSPSRTIYYNDLEVARLADMMGLFHAIIFAPEDLQIVKGGPSERRRFLDVLISRTDRAYFRDLQDFWRVIGQRNRLLKNLKVNGSFNGRVADRNFSDGRTAFDEDESEPPESEMIFPRSGGTTRHMGRATRIDRFRYSEKKARCYGETFRIRIALYTSSDFFAGAARYSVQGLRRSRP
jgi:recombinational DNA repair ATPase RecF